MAHVFSRYSHQAEAWKDRVVKELGVLPSERLDVWDDRKITAAWADEIGTAVAARDVPLPLISARFPTSKFILGEVAAAPLKRRARQGVWVIPPILSTRAWTLLSWRNPIQARPKDGRPLANMGKAPAPTQRQP
jgi:hypothetical protein